MAVEEPAGNGVILRMEQVTKIFPGTVALDKVDYSVRRGKVNGLVGENGAGKSTLMKALCGKVPVVQGDIAYHYASDGVKPQDDIIYVSFDAQRTVLGWQDPFYQARWNSTRSRDGTPVADSQATMFILKPAGEKG